MNLSFKIKHYFFNAFREIFVHHHGSLEFRAKTFALIIAADPDAGIDSFIHVKNYGLEIYKEDEDRANLLMLTTKEMVKKIKEKNGLDIDTLIYNIQKQLKIVPRYAYKIDIKALTELTKLTYDEDSYLYQKNILEFLKKLKDETIK